VRAFACIGKWIPSHSQWFWIS